MSLLPKSACLPGWKLLPNLGDPYFCEHFCLIGYRRARKCTEQKILANSGKLAGYKSAYT